MLKEEKEHKSLLDLKEKQRKHREMKTENEENIKQIDKLKTTCFQLANSVKFEQEKNESLKKEIQFRKNIKAECFLRGGWDYGRFFPESKKSDKPEFK